MIIGMGRENEKYRSLDLIDEFSFNYVYVYQHLILHFEVLVVYGSLLQKSSILTTEGIE